MVRPSRRARACERFVLRMLVETVDVELRLTLAMTSGAGLRETTREGAEWDARSRDRPRPGVIAMEGRRGGVEGTDDDGGVRERFGSSGRVMEGAGFGEGMVRRESRE